MKKNNKNCWLSYLIGIGMVFSVSVLIPFFLVLFKVKIFIHVIKFEDWLVFALLFIIGFFIATIAHCVYLQYERKEKKQVEPIVQVYEESNIGIQSEKPLVSQVSQNLYQRGYLILQGKGSLEDRIYIGNGDFCIGRTANTDLPIQINGISKKHALIKKKNGAYCIMDTNSTNGTQINGEVLQPLTDYQLQSGDKILFATVPYYFYLEV